MLAIYQPADMPVAIVSFAPHITDIAQAASCVVPAGLPFWLAPKADIDALYAEQGEWRDAWQLDPAAMGRVPDGVGEAT